MPNEPHLVLHNTPEGPQITDLRPVVNLPLKSFQKERVAGFLMVGHEIRGEASMYRRRAEQRMLLAA